MLKELDRTEWANVFGLCGERCKANAFGKKLSRGGAMVLYADERGKLKEVCREDVAEVVFVSEAWEGLRAGEGLFRLKDGRWLWLEGKAREGEWYGFMGLSAFLDRVVRALQPHVQRGLRDELKERKKLQRDGVAGEALEVVLRVLAEEKVKARLAKEQRKSRER